MPEILKQIEEVGRPWNREELAKKRNAWVKECIKKDWREGLKEMSVWARDIEKNREKRITLNNNNNNNNMINNNYNSTNTRLEGEGSMELDDDSSLQLKFRRNLLRSFQPLN